MKRGKNMAASGIDADLNDRIARRMEELGHVSVPRAFLRKWLMEQERRAEGRQAPDWAHPVPNPQKDKPVRR